MLMGQTWIERVGSYTEFFENSDIFLELDLDAETTDLHMRRRHLSAEKRLWYEMASIGLAQPDRYLLLLRTVFLRLSASSPYICDR
jgi:hypothetical protein